MLIGELRQKLLGRISGSALEVPLGAALNADLIVPRSRRVGYVGWVGRGNLGDDVFLELYRRRRPDLRFRFLPEQLGLGTLRALWRLNPRGTFGAVLLGGGTIVGQASFRPLVENLLASFPEVPIFAIGVGVEDERYLHSSDNEGDLKAWKPLLQRFAAISVRGPLSQASLEGIGIEAPIAGDPALLAADYRPRVRVRQGLIGMNLGYTRYPGTHGSKEAVQILTDFARSRATSGWRIRCFVFNRNELEHLGPLLGALSQHPGIDVISDRIGLDQFLARIAECHVFIGHRLHSAVLASAMGVPTVALEYLPKCRDFQASLGRGDLSLPTSGLTLEALAASIDRLAENREAEARQIDAALQTRLQGLEAAIAALPGHVR